MQSDAVNVPNHSRWLEREGVKLRFEGPHRQGFILTQLQKADAVCVCVCVCVCAHATGEMTCNLNSCKFSAVAQPQPMSRFYNSD